MEAPLSSIRKVASALLCSTNNIYSAVYCYCRNIPWADRAEGGRPPFLSPAGETAVTDEIVLAISNHCPPSENEVAQIITKQAVTEKRSAFFAATQFSLKPVSDRIAKLNTEPSRQYVEAFLKKHHISLCSPSAITTARDEAATASNILFWFASVFTFDLFCKAIPTMYFNADEINLDFETTAKVCKLHGKQRSPAVTTENTPGHITLMMTIGINFFAPPLFFILGNLKQVPPEISSQFSAHQAEFTANQSGWMTRETFLVWSRMMVQWVTEMRRIGRFLVGLPVILFLDGHISRDCAAAMRLMSENNIIVITFPSQLTHVMQPVDVGIGAPFRNAYRRLLRRKRLQWKSSHPPGEKITAMEKRLMMVAAAVDAAQQAGTKSNREAAFSACGLCPYNPNTPVSSPYVAQDQAAPKHPQGRQTGRDTVSAKILTSAAILPTLTQ
jgi:hypothetical protein